MYVRKIRTSEKRMEMQERFRNRFRAEQHIGIESSLVCWCVSSKAMRDYQYNVQK